MSMPPSGRESPGAFAELVQAQLERILAAHLDERIHVITVRQCLQHTAGWDRDKGFDPMSAEAAEEISRALRVPLPIQPKHIIRYTMGRRLDWAPGTKYAYSNAIVCSAASSRRPRACAITTT